MTRRRLNFISKIQNIQGDIFYAADIEKAFIDYFNDIYMENNIRNWLIGNLHWSCISPVQASNLTRNFEEKEVYSCIKSLGSNQTPGPDGFTIKFFKKILEHIQIRLHELVPWFFLEYCQQSVNATYIALISKKSMSQKVSDYRPISLTMSIYKILVEVLAEGLKVVLPTTIAANQAAFVKGR